MKRFPFFTNIQGACSLGQSVGEYQSQLERRGVIPPLLDLKVSQVKFGAPRIFYLDVTGKKRRYTADLEISYLPGLSLRPLAIEFKYKEALDRDPELLKYYDYIGKELAKLGYDFEVRTENEVLLEDFEVKEFILGHRNDEASPFEEEVLSAIRRHGLVSVGALVTELRRHPFARLLLVPVIWRLVAHKRAFIDYRVMPSMATIVSSTPQFGGT
jgi:hypothetical protein